MNKLKLTKLIENTYSNLYPDKKDIHIQINTDISRFDVWTNQVNDVKQIKNSVVLSSGCGSAGDLFYFINKGAKKVFGIETSVQNAILAKARLSDFPSKKYKIDTYDGNILPYKNNKFDIVFSMHVIEHTNNPYQYIDELIRVTNKNGIIYLELPNKFYPKEQHTNQLFIHWISYTLNNFLTYLKIFKPGYNLINFLSPINIYNYLRKNRNIEILESFVHSYDNDNHDLKYPFFNLYKLISKTTYKIVLKKNE